jgi:hypothetical protein
VDGCIDRLQVAGEQQSVLLRHWYLQEPELHVHLLLLQNPLQHCPSFSAPEHACVVAVHEPPPWPWQAPLVQLSPPGHAAHAAPLVPHWLADWLP